MSQDDDGWDEPQPKAKPKTTTATSSKSTASKPSSTATSTVSKSSASQSKPAVDPKKSSSAAASSSKSSKEDDWGANEDWGNESWGNDGNGGEGESGGTGGDDEGWDDDNASKGKKVANDDDWDAPASEAVKPEMKRQQSFAILTEDDLEKRRQELIKQTAELLFVSDDEAGCLLRHYGWKNNKVQSEWFTDQQKVRTATGLAGREKRPRELPPNTLVQCQSAFCDKVPVEEAFCLDCGHWFCADCWKGYLFSQVTHGRTCVFTRCMGFRCKLNHRHGFGCACDEMVPESVFKKFISDENLLSKYRRWVLDSFVEGQKKIKWCPRPQCGRAVEYNIGGVRDVTCRCGHQFCVSCSEVAHVPAPCDLVKKWKQRESSDDATQIWLQARTKECPKCQVRIEKNRACNHMKCAKCGHDFCWLCKGPWSQHGSATGGYYVCNKYNDDVNKGSFSSEEKNMNDNQQLLQKYTFYYKRFKDSEDAIKFTKNMWKKIEGHLSDQEYAKIAFLQDAVNKLTEARRVLQWTYGMAYYLKSGKEKELFEFQQGLLVEKTEHLQDIMENNHASLEKLLEIRRKIIDLTSSIDKFRKEMVNEVESGEFEALIMNHADISSSFWACTVCKTENRNDQQFCSQSSCQACRKHGEQECKACKKPAS